MLAAEVLASFAANVWFPIDSFAVSLIFPVLVVVIMRWDAFCIIPAVAGAVATCLFEQVSAGRTMSVAAVAVSLSGSLALFSAIPLFLAFGKGNMRAGKSVIREKWYLSAVYVIILYIIANLVTAVADAIITGEAFFPKLVYYMGLNSITLLFAVIIVLISRKLDGVFEDQRTYLIRLEAAREAEKKKPQ